MNQYLCNGFMAEEIFKEVGSIRVKRNKNEMQIKNSIPTIFEEENITVHDKLLADEGSSKYKDWLHRTTTLDDIYRHYAPHKTLLKKHEVHEEPEGEIEEFEGELTGYAMPSSSLSGKLGKLPDHSSIPQGDHMMSSTGYGYPSYGSPIVHSPSAISDHHNIMPTVHEQHIYLPPNDDDEHSIYQGKAKGHDLTIKDFFEIALTALAFLAFGLFIIQLLMNITNPMTMTTLATGGGMATDIDQRFKRNTFDSRPLAYSGNEEINELSHRVLRSIEAVMVAQADTGNCLRRMLCEDNQFSRNTKGGRRIWIPVWSLGMSWTSGRILNHNPWWAVLETMKASVLGLGRADCTSLYPDCELWRERIKRRRRRRK